MNENIIKLIKLIFIYNYFYNVYSKLLNFDALH